MGAFAPMTNALWGFATSARRVDHLPTATGARLAPRAAAERWPGGVKSTGSPLEQRSSRMGADIARFYITEVLARHVRRCDHGDSFRAARSQSQRLENTAI